MALEVLALTACRVDLVRGRAVRDGVEVALTTREVDLLRYLADHPSRVVGRDELLARVWGYADSVVSRACDNAVRRLREKVEADPARPDHVLTVHGAGYRFEPLVGGAADPRPPEISWVDLGPARVSVEARRVSGPDGERALTELEATLLRTLLAAGGRVVSRQELSRAGWGRARAPVTHAVHALRRKLAPADPIATARGGGYRLALAPEAPTADLVGRGSEREAARELLGSADWLLIVGPPGSGKSRLARAVAPEAVWVDLAGVDGPGDAAARVARAIGVELGPGDPIAAVGRALRGRRLVLGLDPLDALGAGALPLVEAWRGRPGALIAASRARLGAPREAVVEVGPLAPDDAVELFVDRARAASPSFRDGEVDRERVRALVDRVDRLPLAIELLAARTSSLGSADLLARVGADLLVGPAGGMVGAVRATLRALPDGAGAALSQLARFRHGFFVDDAEAVLGPDAVDLVQVLRDRSLLRRLPDHAGQARFDTWQVVRDLLPDDPGEQRRYVERLARLGDDPRRALWFGAEDALERRIAQLDELRNALGVATALGEPVLAARCAIGACVVLQATGPFGDGVALATGALAADPPDGPRAWLLLLRGQLHYARGEAAQALADWRAAAECAVRADLPEVEGMVGQNLGAAGQHVGRPEAREAFARASAAWRRAGDAGWAALAEGRLRYGDGDAAGARRLGSEALRRGRAAGDRPLVLRAAILLAAEAYVDGRFEDARDAIAAELEVARFTTHRWDALHQRLALALAFDDLDGLRQLVPALAELAGRVGSPLAQAQVHQARAALATLEGRWDDAARELDQADLHHDVGRDALVVLGQRIELARRSGRPEAALRLAEQQAEAARALGLDGVAAGAEIEIGLAKLASGDVAGSRAAFEAAPPLVGRTFRAHRLAWETALRRAEGDAVRAREGIEELRAEVVRSGRRYPEDERELLVAILGPV